MASRLTEIRPGASGSSGRRNNCPANVKSAVNPTGNGIESKHPATVAVAGEPQTGGMYTELTTEYLRVPARPTNEAQGLVERVLGFAPMRGALAGTVATVPMTLFIHAMDRMVPHEERGELPPRQITEEIDERANAEKRASKTTLDVTSGIAHFGFGAATGAIYGSVAERVPLSATATGIGFGLAVWAASYAGALPELGLQRPPESRPFWRTATMIAGHVVWGAALGWSEEWLRTLQGAVGRGRNDMPDRRPGPAEIHW
jgi:uncharacterized membrane protein YagU involved in acid resistance